jgi:hypothetical protein
VYEGHIQTVGGLDPARSDITTIEQTALHPCCHWSGNIRGAYDACHVVVPVDAVENRHKHSTLLAV